MVQEYKKRIINTALEKVKITSSFSLNKPQLTYIDILFSTSMSYYQRTPTKVYYEGQMSTKTYVLNWSSRTNSKHIESEKDLLISIRKGVLDYAAQRRY